MAGGRDYSHHQRKIIDRYYEHQDSIVATRLGELVGDIALAGDDQKKLDRLWKRAEAALAKTNLKPARVQSVLESRDVEALGRLVAGL